MTAAVQCGGEVHVLIAGHNASGAAQAASKIAGVAKVLHADAPQLAEQLGETIAAQVVALAANYSHLLFPATAHGKNVAPRVAALLDVAQISDATKVISADTFERPIYAGSAIATVQSLDAKKVITVRTTGFDAAGAGGSAAIESHRRGGRQRPVELRRQRDRQERPARTDGGQDHRQRWPRDGFGRQVHRRADAAGRQARRGAGRQPRGGRRRLRAQRLAGRPDRQDRRAAACTSPAASAARSSTWRA